MPFAYCKSFFTIFLLCLCVYFSAFFLDYAFACVAGVGGLFACRVATRFQIIMNDSVCMCARSLWWAIYHFTVRFSQNWIWNLQEHLQHTPQSIQWKIHFYFPAFFINLIDEINFPFIFHCDFRLNESLNPHVYMAHNFSYCDCSNRD